MFDNERTWTVKRLLCDYVKSPSLRHIRDEHSITKPAHDIVQRLDHGSPIWTKWNQHREQLVKGAVGCWVPIPDLRKFLNGMPGPALTETDVAQRLRAFEEELSDYPNDELKEACLTLYQAEQNEGTELPAIVGRLREFIESEAIRLHEERQIAWRTAQGSSARSSRAAAPLRC